MRPKIFFSEKIFRAPPSVARGSKRTWFIFDQRTTWACSLEGPVRNRGHPSVMSAGFRWFLVLLIRWLILLSEWYNTNRPYYVVHSWHSLMINFSSHGASRLCYRVKKEITNSQETMLIPRGRRRPCKFWCEFTFLKSICARPVRPRARKFWTFASLFTHLEIFYTTFEWEIPSAQHDNLVVKKK